jgi:sugar phosphate isomerase/epimerase
MKPWIGATSYVFRYLLSDPARAPRLGALMQLARAVGLDALQICENARPLAASPVEWQKLAQQAAAMGLSLSLGCMTFDPDVVTQYLDRVEAIGGSYLRIVLEREGAPAMTMDRICRFLDDILPELAGRGIRLAIENHFEIPSQVLAEAASGFAPDLIGFCVDVANSLRNFEDTESVLQLLSPRAVCYHLKDYVVDGTNVGFAVTGAPFGQGRIKAQQLLRRILEGRNAQLMFLETWTPKTGNWQRDVEEDAAWLAASVSSLRALLAAEDAV